MKEDLTGQQFGNWTVLAKAGLYKNTRNYTYLCRCSCGVEKTVVGTTLYRGKSKSCGCLRDSLARERTKTHGMRKTSVYNIWSGMKSRCFDERCSSFQKYGGRGVTVCERWLDFENFYADMGDRPKGMSLDRFPDVNGNYEPSNCRWATSQEQANNRRDTLLVTFKGETKSLTLWCRELNVKYTTVRARMLRGLTFEEAVCC